MNFLNRLKQFFRNTSTSDSDIKNEEIISRFIFEKKHFNASEKRIKYAAFMPPKNLKASVYRTSTLSNNQVWEIGREYVEKNRNDGKLIEARGTIPVARIRSKDLDVISEPTPHYLHADIVEWSLDRSSQKLVATELANEATLILKIKNLT